MCVLRGRGEERVASCWGLAHNWLLGPVGGVGPKLGKKGPEELGVSPRSLPHVVVSMRPAGGPRWLCPGQVFSGSSLLSTDPPPGKSQATFSVSH